MPFERDAFDVVVARNVLPLVPPELRPAVVGDVLTYDRVRIEVTSVKLRGVAEAIVQRANTS